MSDKIASDDMINKLFYFNPKGIFGSRKSFKINRPPFCIKVVGYNENKIWFKHMNNPFIHKDIIRTYPMKLFIKKFTPVPENRLVDNIDVDTWYENIENPLELIYIIGHSGRNKIFYRKFNDDIKDKCSTDVHMLHMSPSEFNNKFTSKIK